ncbi:MAG TPA: DUF4235 domain-containing protein [Egibacteraceae bacterium]|nr:DUF4235 domain-containing protein [Egibacteraceae bacterium]
MTAAGKGTPASGRGAQGGDGLVAKVDAVRDARERLERDVDLMTAELKATVGVTMEKSIWKAVTIGAGVLAGALVRKLLNAAWRGATHADPPTDPYQPAGWGEAVTWAAASGIGIGVARLVAARGAAAGWHKAMGAPPPGVSAPV